MSTPKKIAGTMVIPVLTFLILEMICMAHGNNIITNMKSFDNFVVYTAIVMLTTIALSINLNSGRFDFSLGSMAARIHYRSKIKLCGIGWRRRKCSVDAVCYDRSRSCIGVGIRRNLCFT